MIAIMLKEMKCPRPECGHKWIPRTKDPVMCPRCKCFLNKNNKPKPQPKNP
jgi:hypothetical protein